MPETAVTPGSTAETTVTIVDDDNAGIVFMPTSLTVTEEDADGESYTVKLATKPSSNVTVTITGHSDTNLSLSGDGLSGDALTFTTLNWNAAQSVTVTAAHDDNGVTEIRSLTHSASGGGYANVSNDLSVTVTDDDPAVTVQFGQSAYSVNEGSTVDVTVTLSADPRRTVVIPITVANQGTVTTDDYTGVPETVTFTSGDTSETITFQARSDDVDDADGEAVKLGFGTMPETAVTAGTTAETTVTIVDDDNAGIVFMPTSLTVTEEDADGESYTVKLATKPSSNVTVTITGHSDTNLTLSGDGLSGDALTFTTENWNAAQSVTVTAAHDDNGVTEIRSLTHSASGGGYANVSNDLSVTVTDDDPAVTVSFGQSAYSVNEGSTVDVTVTLSADPRRTVVIPIAVANQGTVTTDDYSGVPETVTFTSGDTSETITFQARSDDVDDADGEAVKLGFGTMPETAVTAGHDQRDHRHHRRRGQLRHRVQPQGPFT